MIYMLGALELHTNQRTDAAYLTLNGKRITEPNDVTWADDGIWFEVHLRPMRHTISLMLRGENRPAKRQGT